MAVQDLKTVCGIREERPELAHPALVAVDEFSALAGDQIAGVFQRARSAGLSLLLATQELAHLRRIDERFNEQIVGNVEHLLAGRQNNPHSAETVAAIAGTEEVWVHTFRTEEGPRSRRAQLVANRASAHKTPWPRIPRPPGRHQDPARRADAADREEPPPRRAGGCHARRRGGNRGEEGRISRPSPGSESAKRLRQAPRLALTRQEAAAALGMSINSFERYVQPELRLVRREKLRLIPVREIERWLEENSDVMLEQLGGR
jgi:hypothetical protein